MQARAAIATAVLPDPSFRALLGELAWRRLVPAVRARFAAKPAPGTAILYRGTMREVRASWAGKLLAEACRLIGTPLARYGGRDVPVSVRLRLDADGNGIVWESTYHFAQRAPITGLSVKCAESSGLVEIAGAGIAQVLAECRGALHFRSAGYFWRWRRWRLALPRWLTPGEMHVVHADLGGGRFRVAIAVTHPLFGEIIRQDGVFAEERR